jgi:ABC-type phosphate transport system substrate-binding protein
MKKFTKLMMIAICCVTAFVVTGCGCSSNNSIAVISRDAVSGSRQAFDYSVRNAEGQSLTTWQGTAGNKIRGDQFNSQAGVISAVRGNKRAIGYASLSAVENNSNVKILNVDGAAPGATGYPAAFIRDFIILVPESVALLPRTAQFYSFLSSTQARDATVTFGLDFGVASPTAYAPIADPGQSHPIQIRGSTTVTPLMEHLVARFVEITPWATQAMFDLNAGGSGQGRSVGANNPIVGAQSYISGAAIGMSSSGADINAAGTTFALAADTTVVIVHPSNKLDNITVAQIYSIYTGAIKKWSNI